MRNSETRSIFQAAYSPIDRNIKPSIVKKGSSSVPFLKTGVLTFILNDKDLGKFLLGELVKINRTPITKKLVKVYNQIGENDVSKSINGLNKIKIKDVISFSEKVLRLESDLLDDSEKEIDKIIISIIDKKNQDKQSSSETKKELYKFKTEIAKKLKSRIKSKDLSTIKILSNKILSELNVSKNLPIITRNEIQKELNISKTKTKSYLEKTRFFTLPKFTEPIASNESTHLLSFVSAMRHVNANKRKFLKTITELVKEEPVGYLHLERLDFVPVGFVRGDLIYSLPLLPNETVKLTHREWSKTETEYVKLVATSLEKASEESLSETSELSHSSRTQEIHSSNHDVSATASGSAGPIHITSSVGYGSSGSETISRESSGKLAREITQKASSRSKAESKTSFKIIRQFGVEDESYREISNPSSTPVRYDFHRLMKKWRIDLYRYDVRLTYDIVIPEPGSYLLRRYWRLKEIEDLLNESFEFTMSPLLIDEESVDDLSLQYGVALDPPPKKEVWTFAHDTKIFSDRVVGDDILNLVLPKGYIFDPDSATPLGFDVTVDGSHEYAGFIDPLEHFNKNNLRAGAQNSNSYPWLYQYDFSNRDRPNRGSQFSIYVTIRGILSKEAFHEWQLQTFEKLVESSKAKFQEEQIRLTKQRDHLIEELKKLDSLALRKIEKEEIMKGVLRWILGPDFSFYPQNLPKLDLSSKGDIEHYDQSTQNVKENSFEATIKHGEIIRFLHHAIEWENVNYILYPYFWTDDYRWDFKQSLFHPDYVHRNFLRSGAARIVMTIRPGFEKDFLSYMETGSRDGLPRNHPYITVAEELKNMAKESYPYTPNANEENEKNKVDTWYEFTPTTSMDVTEGDTLEIE